MKMQQNAKYALYGIGALALSAALSWKVYSHFSTKRMLGRQVSNGVTGAERLET